MKKIVQLLFSFSLVAVILAGCGGSSNYSTSSAPAEAYGDYDYAYMEEAAEAPMADNGGMWAEKEVPAGNGNENLEKSNRKLIKTVNMTLQTKEFDTLINNIVAEVNALGGYVENSSISGNSYYGSGTRWANYTIRIPAKNLEQFVIAAGEMGNVTQKNESVEDVTLQYVDTESRKKSLETEQKRLLELMEQAESMEDILAIESKLSEIRYQLENYGSQLRVLDNQIDYSKVYIDIDEVERITEVREKTFFEEIAERFDDNVYAVKKGLRNFTIWFIGSLPIFAVWAVVLFIVYLIVRKCMPFIQEKTRARREKNWEKIARKKALREQQVAERKARIEARRSQRKKGKPNTEGTQETPENKE